MSLERGKHALHFSRRNYLVSVVCNISVGVRKCGHVSSVTDRFKWKYPWLRAPIQRRWNIEPNKIIFIHGTGSTMVHCFPRFFFFPPVISRDELDPKNKESCQYIEGSVYGAELSEWPSIHFQQKYLSTSWLWLIYTMMKDFEKKFLSLSCVENVSPDCPLSSPVFQSVCSLHSLGFSILLQRGEAARTACTAGEQTVGSGLWLPNSLLCSELLLPASASHQ